MLGETMKKKEELQEEEYIFPYHYLDLGTKQYQLWHLGQNAQLRSILTLANIKKGARALDAGCGDGRFCYEFRKRFGRTRTIIGVDFSERAISLARIFNPDVEFIVADLRTFKKGPFDYIFSNQVIEHIPPQDLSDTVIKLTKLLKPGGKLLISVPSRLLRMPAKHYQHFDEDGLRAILERQFKSVKVRGYNKRSALQILFKLKKLYALVLLVVRPKNYETYVCRLETWYEQRLGLCEPAKGYNLIVICTKERK